MGQLNFKFSPRLPNKNQNCQSEYMIGVLKQCWKPLKQVVWSLKNIKELISSFAILLFGLHGYGYQQSPWCLKSRKGTQGRRLIKSVFDIMWSCNSYTCLLISGKLFISSLSPYPLSCLRLDLSVLLCTVGVQAGEKPLLCPLLT